MTDTKSGDDKTLTVNTKKTLTLKRPGVEQGTVRQNFSHGRTKSVVVETKKRKFSIPGERQEQAPLALNPRPQPAAPRPAPPPQAPVARQPQPQREAPRAPAQADRSGVVLNDLSGEEIEARRRALEESRHREIEEARPGRRPAPQRGRRTPAQGA